MVTEVKMNQEKLKMLQAQVRIGGKGTVRRKKKVVHRTATTDDKKLQSSLKKLSGDDQHNGVSSLPLFHLHQLGQGWVKIWRNNCNLRHFLDHPGHPADYEEQMCLFIGRY